MSSNEQELSLIHDEDENHATIDSSTIEELQTLPTTTITITTPDNNNDISPGKINNWQAFVNSFKSFVGVGILALPFAISQSGILLGVISLTLIGITSAHTINQVVRIKNKLYSQQRPADSYETVAREILGRTGYIATVASIASCQLGFCISYVLFLVQSISYLLSAHLGHFDQIFIDRVATMLLLPFLIALSLIREMKSLSLMSAIGGVILFLGIVLISSFGITKLDIKPTYPAFRLETYYLFFGLAVFGFEGVNLAVPIETAMLHRRSYPKVLNFCVFCIGLLYISFGVLGYLCFGDNTQAVILENLPREAWITRVVALCLVLEVLVTYPLQLWPVLGLLEQQIPPDNAHASKLRIFIRVGSALLIVVAATALPYFSLFANLVGALANSATMFIIPPLLELAFYRQDATRTMWIVNIGILLFGIAASGISSVLTMKDIVEAVAE